MIQYSLHGTIRDRIDKKTPKKPEEFCMASFAMCTMQGFGADDCVQSISVCDVNSNKKDALFCCNSEFKSQYFEARCSGLDVQETFRWLK